MFLYFLTILNNLNFQQQKINKVLMPINKLKKKLIFGIFKSSHITCSTFSLLSLIFFTLILFPIECRNTNTKTEY